MPCFNPSLPSRSSTPCSFSFSKRIFVIFSSLTVHCVYVLDSTNEPEPGLGWFFARFSFSSCHIVACVSRSRLLFFFSRGFFRVPLKYHRNWQRGFIYVFYFRLCFFFRTYSRKMCHGISIIYTTWTLGGVGAEAALVFDCNFLTVNITKWFFFKERYR